MKYYYLFIFSIFLLVSCSSGGGGSDSTPTPTVLGCTDDCALNYNPDANEDDGLCIYSFLGTWKADVYSINGVDAMTALDVYWSFGVTDASGIGVYTYYAFYEGSSLSQLQNIYSSGGGTFTNSMISLTLYPSTGEPAEEWIVSKLNCYEFDGSHFDPLTGDNYYIETQWFPTSHSIFLSNKK